ncbi:cell envelope biogenesis protein AsmA [Sulfuricaulis limicola]|uniref:Cell envelope biogenesis protein AsmA n=1 Tax=Sulfuricaulis limicola TaxID=1620215 RepID=A0A1B4XCH2_9GAMM|nr:AsmA family protein [Sulfuricaulis limicola]BAV32508.1 cell envelope biogenesis protein AsmA [Sulfuricaulis limicola]
MKKTLKILGLVLGGLVALFIVATVTLSLLFDPNDYKDDIIKLVRDKTGRELRIEGKLGWSFFPWIGFETGKLELGNAPGFGPEPFARLDGAGAKVELLPLLRLRVSVDTVFLNGLKLNLAKNTAGKTNWDDLLAPADKAKPAEKPAAKPETGKEFDIRSVSVNKIDIRKADVSWKDQASNAQYAVRNLDLQTGRIVVGEPVDVHLAFDVESGKPPVSKHLDLKSRIKLDLEKQSLEITNLALAVDESSLTGSLAIKNFGKPAYRFDLALDQIDLDRYMPAPAPADAAKPAATAPAEPVEIPLSLLRSLDLQGKLGIGKLKTMNLRSTDVTVQVSAKNGLITLGPNKAKLYNGSYAGHTALDVRGKTPLLTIDESVSGIELAPALKDALQFDKFTGTANLGAKVTAQGLDANRIMETLNGTASFSVQKGAVRGMDLKKMIDTVKTAQRDNLLQKLTELKPQPADETPFTQLSGTARITNGVVQNDDLKVQSPDLVNVSGKGSADLPRQTLDYRVTVGEYPIIISGPFASPKFRVDTSALLKGKVEQKKEEAKQKVEQKLEQKLKDKLKFLK